MRRILKVAPDPLAVLLNLRDLTQSKKGEHG